MTRRTQPDYFERLLVVVVMSMRLALATAKRAVIGAYQNSLFHGTIDGSMRTPHLWMVSLPFKNVLREFLSVIRSPLSVGFAHPLTMLLSIVLNVLLVAFVDFFRIAFAVLAVAFLVFRKVFESIFLLVLLACFYVFERHSGGSVPEGNPYVDTLCFTEV